MDKNRIRTIAVFLWCIFVTGRVYAETVDLETQLKDLYKKAEIAVKEKVREKADFYLARYMGKTLFNQHTEKNISDLYPLFKGHDLAPTSFISSKYSDEFLEWFIYRPALYWKHDEAIWDEDSYLFELVANDNGKYFAIVTAYPYLEGWYVRQDNKDTTAVIAYGDFRRKPQLVAGTLVKGKVSKEYPKIDLDTEEHPLQHVWTPEFHDLDNDGIPEIWIRYNKAWGSGFSQELAIYQIRDDKLTLFKKFTGDFEGIARRLDDNTIETGYGFTTKEATGHMGYDQHHIETWEYKDGDFVKIAERNVPHILWSDEWKKYYFKEEEGNEK